MDENIMRILDGIQIGIADRMKDVKEKDVMNSQFIKKEVRERLSC